LHDLLKDTLNAEKQLVRALPKMAKASTSASLKKAFEKHLGETEKQVARLEKVFASIGLKIAGKKCEAMEGLITEASEAVKETPKGSLVRDVALIVAAQKVEHYEMAAYGSLRSIANILGLDKAAESFQKTLDEETNADKKLSEISDSINSKAASGVPKPKKLEAKSGNQKAKASSSETNDMEDEDEEDNDVEDAVYLDSEEEEGEDSSGGKTPGGFGNSL